MDDLLDMITSDESPSQISDKIKELLFAKSAEKIDTVRPEVAATIFADAEEEWWLMADLSDFFKLVAEDKKKKKEEFNAIVGDLNLNSIFEKVTTLKKKNKVKKRKKKKL